MSGTTMMTEQDLIDAGPLSQRVLDVVTRNRPPAAVAAVARALAAVAHLAGCGPEAAITLFRKDFEAIGRMK